MRANLTYILLAFYLLCSQLSTAQDFGKKGIPPQKPKIDSVFTQSKDSLISLKNNALINKKIDTVANDSIKPKEVIDGIITHNAEDYTIQDAKNKTITLYNKAVVKYTDIDLQAGIIILDYKNNMVYAKGIKDSTGYHQSTQWAHLWPVAWADFYRFLLGWSPEHKKINSYMHAQVNNWLGQMSSGPVTDNNATPVDVVAESTITCPQCGHVEVETMPTNACQWFYDCKGCGTLLKPKPGDCCVFCSYGDVACPPIQQGEACC